MIGCPWPWSASSELFTSHSWMSSVSSEPGCGQPGHEHQSKLKQIDMDFFITCTSYTILT